MKIYYYWDNWNPETTIIPAYRMYRAASSRDAMRWIHQRENEIAKLRVSKKLSHTVELTKYFCG